MANEVTIQVLLQVNKGTARYSSNPVTFRADIEDDGKGPSPGAVTVTSSGLDITFSELSEPSLCRLENTDDEEIIEYGMRDLSTGVFYPMGEIWPGEFYPLRFSRNMTEEHIGTGTGAAGAAVFHMKTYGDSAIAKVEAFNR